MNFDDDDVPEKTAQGAAEIRTRALGALKLPARLRTVLLLVDGVKPLRELKAMLSAQQALIPALVSLQELGLLRLRKPDGAPSPVVGTLTAAPPSSASPLSSATEPVDTPESTTTPAVAEHIPSVVALDQFRRARAHLANALDENLGVHGYLLRQQVASCTTVGELATLFAAVQSNLSPVLGEDDVAAIVEQARQLLPVSLLLSHAASTFE